VKPENRPLLGSEEWKFLLLSSPPRYRELAERLDADDVAALIDYLESASTEERTAAVALLQGAIRENIPINAAKREELVARLRPIMASYPDQPGLGAFILMSQLEPSIAEKFIVESVEASNISDGYFKHYLADLRRVKSSRAMDRIVAYSALEGPRGETAKRFLKTMGIIDSAEVHELVARWRDSRSVDCLNDLQNFFIQHQIGKPIGPLLELLGPWNRHSFNEYWYDSTEGPSLFLQEDEQANLRAAKIK
jgi:hypothetical protein